MNRKELSEVVAECAARTERAAARTEEAAARTEVARAGIEEARRRQEAATARIEESDARWGEQTEEYREWSKRQEKRTDELVAELRDGRDERRAMLEALFKVMDRLPPPPPNLRSA